MTDYDWHRPTYIGRPGPLQNEGDHDLAKR